MKQLKKIILLTCTFALTSSLVPLEAFSLFNYKKIEKENPEASSFVKNLKYYAPSLGISAAVGTFSALYRIYILDDNNDMEVIINALYTAISAQLTTTIALQYKKRAQQKNPGCSAWYLLPTAMCCAIKTALDIETSYWPYYDTVLDRLVECLQNNYYQLIPATIFTMLEKFETSDQENDNTDNEA